MWSLFKGKSGEPLERIWIVAGSRYLHHEHTFDFLPAHRRYQTTRELIQTSRSIQRKEVALPIEHALSEDRPCLKVAETGIFLGYWALPDMSSLLLDHECGSALYNSLSSYFTGASATVKRAIRWYTHCRYTLQLWENSQLPFIIDPANHTHQKHHVEKALKELPKLLQALIKNMYANLAYLNETNKKGEIRLVNLHLKTYFRKLTTGPFKTHCDYECDPLIPFLNSTLMRQDATQTARGSASNRKADNAPSIDIFA